MPNFISEDDIERAILEKLQREFGFAVLNCYTATAEDLNDRSGRADKREVILRDRLRAAALRLNPAIPEPAIDAALVRLTDKRHAMSPVAANREVDGLIRDGIPVEFENAQGKKQQERVRVIDFNDRQANDFLAVAQLWVKGERGYRRPDILLYINGLPLVFIELKNSNVKLRTAFDNNLTSYKKEIPQLFLTNAFCILSNAIETKVGSCTAGWEHYFNWLRVADEKEKVDRVRIKQTGTCVELAIAGQAAGLRGEFHPLLQRDAEDHCKPEILGRPVVRSVAVFQYLRGVIDSIIEQTDIDAVSVRIGQLLDESVVVNDAEAFNRQDHSAEYQLIRKGKTWDLSKINFDKLKEDFQQTAYKNIEIADLRAFIQKKLEQMLQQNLTRTDFAQRLQEIVDAYNAGGSSTENYFEDLVNFAKELHAEDERHIREGLTEDEAVALI